MIINYDALMIIVIAFFGGGMCLSIMAAMLFDLDIAHNAVKVFGALFILAVAIGAVFFMYAALMQFVFVS